MKLYYVAVHFEDKQYMGNLKEIGYWEHYHVYEIEDHVLARLDLTRTRLVVLPSLDVAMGWLFANPQTGAIKVSDRGGISEYVRSLSGEHIPYTKERIKYTITDKDTENGIAFAKLILHEKVDRDFENMWEYIKPQAAHSRILFKYAAKDRSSEALKEYVSSRKAQYEEQFSALAEVLFDTHVMIDQMSSVADVHAFILHHYNQVNNLPAEIKDRKTTDV